MSRKNLALVSLLAAVALVIVAGIVSWRLDLAPEHNNASPAGMGVINAAPVGGPFELVDHTGTTVTDRRYAGKYLLVFFGFTFCPDICPTELTKIAETMDLLGADSAMVQPLFITVDPQRDTVPVLADYVTHFHPALVGLSGTSKQIQDVAKAYKVYFARAGADDSADYLMNHSAFIYLMGPDGANLKLFSPRATAEQMATVIRAQLRPAS
jgi:cytochrome oxidase Cu insertion factor (SCO1/SenC/PrrC family)